MKHIYNHDDVVFDQRNGVNADHLWQEDKRAILTSRASDLYLVRIEASISLGPRLATGDFLLRRAIRLEEP